MNMQTIQLKQIQLRQLLTIMIISSIPLIVLSTFLDPILGDIIFNIWIYTIPLVWILGNIKRMKINFKLFVGNLPMKSDLISIVVIVLLLAFFTIGTTIITIYFISLISPRYANELLNIRGLNFSNPLYYNIFNILISVILAPIVEEFLYRGILLYKFSFKQNIRLGIIISSLFFGILHIDLIGSFVFGIIMCLLYLKTKTLVIPIMSHSLYNFIFLIVEQYYYTQHVVQVNMEEFQQYIIWGIIFLCIFLPFIIVYIFKHFKNIEI